MGGWGRAGLQDSRLHYSYTIFIFSDQRITSECQYLDKGRPESLPWTWRSWTRLKSRFWFRAPVEAIAYHICLHVGNQFLGLQSMKVLTCSPESDLDQNSDWLMMWLCKYDHNFKRGNCLQRSRMWQGSCYTSQNLTVFDKHEKKVPFSRKEK